MAAVFYGAFGAVAWGWSAFAGHPSVFWLRLPVDGAELSLHVGIGVAFGLLVVAFSRWAVDNTSWAQGLVDWFHEVLGPLSWHDAFVLALFSAFGEEMLFRGAMVPTLGIAVSSVLFGLVHLPPTKKLLPWTVMAGVLGVAFAFAYEWTGNLAAPIAAHFTINLLNLRSISALARPQIPPPPS